MNDHEACGSDALSDDLDRFIRDQQSDPEFAGAFEDAAERSSVLRELVELRKRQGMSQSAVARRMGTTQSAVSEMEGGASDARLSTLQRYARSVDARLHVSLASGRGRVGLTPEALGVASTVLTTWSFVRSTTLDPWSSAPIAMTTTFPGVTASFIELKPGGGVAATGLLESA